LRLSFPLSRSGTRGPGEYKSKIQLKSKEKTMPLRNLLFVAGSLGLLGSAVPVSADIVQVSVTENLIGGAGIDCGGCGVSYSNSSNLLNSSLGFGLTGPGYFGEPTSSSGSASWSNTSTDISYSDTATQMVTPSPAYYPNESDAGFSSSYTVYFKVNQASYLTITGTQSTNPSSGTYTGGGSSGLVEDGSATLYGWSGAVTSGKILLTAGDLLSIQYNVGYVTKGCGIGSIGCGPTATEGDSFDANITAAVPEPASILPLGLGLLGFAMATRKHRRG
jgi:hypothetical protein